MLSYVRFCAAVSVAGALLTFGQAALAQRLVSEKAKLNDCHRVVGKDSVVFFYTEEYLLVPPGCAALRRHLQLDSLGRFRGFARDYRLSNNQLVLQGAYRNGLKEGLFELYHATGELAARGRYRQGQQIGDWAYWYPSGNRRQVLSFGAGHAPLVQQFWTDSGEQLVKNGQGQWQREQNGLRLRGNIVAGMPDGRWLLRRATDESLVARETFAKGHFRHGIIIDSLEDYQDQSRIYLADWEDYSQAEAYKLGAPCPVLDKKNAFN